MSFEFEVTREEIGEAGALDEGSFDTAGVGV